MIKSKKKKTEALSFGMYFKKLRIANKQTLRGFCLASGYDSSNVSKLERGVLSAPSNKKLRNYAKALKLKEGSSAWTQFFDLAVASGKTISLKDIKNQNLVKFLPVFIRTADGRNLTEKDLDALLDLIRAN